MKKIILFLLGILFIQPALAEVNKVTKMEKVTIVTDVGILKTSTFKIAKIKIAKNEHNAQEIYQFKAQLKTAYDFQFKNDKLVYLVNKTSINQSRYFNRVLSVPWKFKEANNTYNKITKNKIKTRYKGDLYLCIF